MWEGSGTPGALDETPLIRAAQRDRRAFAPLYERYVDAIYRYCLRRTGYREAAEDATATIFTKAMAHLDSFRFDGRSFRSWLFAIAHNVLVDGERAAANRPVERDVHVAIDAAPGPEDVALDAEADREIVRLLLALPVDQRRVLELRLAGLTTREISNALRISDGAVRASQYRAAKRLRLLIRPLSNGEPNAS